MYRVVDDCRFEAGGAASSLRAVRRYPGAATSLPAGECLRDHEIHGYAIGREPAAWLRMLQIAVELCRGHPVVQQWVVAQHARVEGEVAVLGCLSERHRRSAGMQVDRLGADQNQRLTLLSQ